MKNSVAVFAIIAVAAVSLGVSGISANTLMTASTPVLASNSAFTGHLEYTLLDSSGNVKAYGQTDNIITTIGDRCIAEAIFESGSGDSETNATNCNENDYNYFILSNNTSIGINDETNAGTEVAANSSTLGVIASVQATAVNIQDSANAGTGGVTVELTNSDHPFTFTDSVNATNQLEKVYLTGAGCTLDSSALGTLCGEGFPTTEAIAAQTLSSLSISDGDSLTITWTITVGADST